MKLLLTLVILVFLGNGVLSKVEGVSTSPGVLEEEDEYRGLYDELLPRVEQLLNETFNSPQARALQDIASRKYNDAKDFAEKENWSKAYDFLKASYDFLTEAARVEESYFQELRIALLVVLPILVLLHMAYLVYRRYHRASRR